MNITQTDLNDFAALVHDMYKTREDKEHRIWFEQPSTSQLDHRDVVDAWAFKRTVLFFSPIDALNRVLPNKANIRLRVLMAIKQAELKADFTGHGAHRVFRALVGDMLEQFGWSDFTARMIDILHAITIGPRMYEAEQGHFPLDEHSFVIAFTADPDGAIQRHY